MEVAAATSRIPRRIAIAAGVTVFATGLVVLSGWLFAIPELKDIRPGWPNMAPASALGFVLVGAALWLTAAAPNRLVRNHPRSSIVRTCAAVTALFGLVKVGHYGLNLNLNFDTLGFADTAYVAPASALDFLLAGCALWLDHSDRYFGLFQFLTLACGLVGALGLASYLYGGEALLPYAQMAMHTSLLFVVLSVGMLCTRTDGGLMALLVSRTAGGRMAFWMLTLMPPVAIFIQWLKERAEATRWFAGANPDPLFALLDVIVLGALIWIAGARLQRVDSRRASEAAMRRQHEGQLRLFVEYAPAAIAMLDREMRYIAVSRRWLADYQLGTQSLVGRSHYEVFPDIPEHWREIHRRCLAGVVEKCEQDAFPRADGSTDWIQWEIRPWREKSGDVGGIMLFSEVITERVQSAEKIRRLNRVYAVMSQINSLIIRVHDRQLLFDEACRIAVEHGTFGFAWIGLFHAATNEIVPVASAGHAVTDPPLTGIAVTEGTRQSQSLPALALREGRPRFDNDLAASRGPENERYREILGSGYRSVIALPLIVDNVTTGIISMWAREENFFDAEELKLLGELAGDISFALQFLTKQEELDYISYFDILTGLSNRTLFLDRLNQELRARSPESKVVALLLFDIEHFSMVNDTLGRGGADEVLRLVARRLEHACHGTDDLARLGADTFALVLRGVRGPADVAHKIEDRLLPCFKEPFEVADTVLRISARIGVAESPADGDTAETLLLNAEAALKQAKASGSRYLFYVAEMNARAAQALSLETGLRVAVERREFVLYYQPKVSLEDGRLSGLEGLIRWHSPDLGLISPAQFIPILEETGLIVEVGKWVLERALSDFGTWKNRGYPVPRIAVNVSAVQLRQQDFARGIVDLLEDSGLDPDALELEITESLIMEDFERNIRALSILRGMGIHVAIDDFGTGYSSLSYLARLPVDRIKIDRSFISGIVGGTQDRVVVSTIITLAHSLGIPVIAEGVETKEQAQTLRELGCDEAQGYYFCKPLPPDAAGKLLASPPRLR